MKKVIAFGTFDIFHKGHINYLSQAKKLGDFLIVVVARDKTVLENKTRLPKNNERKRLKAVRENGIADKVILGNLKDKFAVIRKYKPDIIALGYDQKFFIDKLSQKLIEFKQKGEIIRLKPFKPEIYKSSRLKNRFKKRRFSHAENL